jgi:hypothetical protein
VNVIDLVAQTTLATSFAHYVSLLPLLFFGTSMDSINDALSDLLSLRSSSAQLTSALSRLNGSLAAIALEPALERPQDGSPLGRTDFLASQGSFLHNGMHIYQDHVAASSQRRTVLSHVLRIQLRRG